MRIALAVLILATGCVASSTGASSSGGSAPQSKAAAPKSDTHAIQSPGCLWVGEAENTYNETVDGVQNKTMTPADAAAAMGKVQKKLQDAALIAELPAVVAHARTGAVHAGRLRVTFLGSGDADVAAEVDALTADMQAADSACSA